MTETQNQLKPGQLVYVQAESGEWVVDRIDPNPRLRHNVWVRQGAGAELRTLRVNPRHVKPLYYGVSAEEARDGDEVFRGGEWRPTTKVTITERGNILIAWLGGGSESSPLSHAPTFRRARFERKATTETDPKTGVLIAADAKTKPSVAKGNHRDADPMAGYRAGFDEATKEFESMSGPAQATARSRFASMKARAKLGTYEWHEAIGRLTALDLMLLRRMEG